MPRPLLIGAGNPLAGDDAAGREVARRIAAAGLPFDVTEAGGEATALLALFEARAQVLIVDACRSGAAPGTLHRFDANAGPLPAFIGSISSHGLGVAAAIELGRGLGLLPGQCHVCAIEGGGFEPGAPLSGPVEAAVARLVEDLGAAGPAGWGTASG